MTKVDSESGQCPTSPLFGSLTRVYRRSLRCHLGFRLFPCSCQSSNDAWKARACTLMVMELILTDMPSTTFSANPYSLEQMRHTTVSSQTLPVRPQEALTACADQKAHEWLPLACCDGYRGGAIRGAWLLTRPHFHFYFIQELHIEKGEL